MLCYVVFIGLILIQNQVADFPQCRGMGVLLF